uniref:filamin-A-interacting protein 1 isoform X1 n=2 Tax=Myxine glutinosa TaxID=7769 RepID=UPI0035900C1D
MMRSKAGETESEGSRGDYRSDDGSPVSEGLVTGGCTEGQAPDCAVKKGRSRKGQRDNGGRARSHGRIHGKAKSGRELSREELLWLLSLLEGEVQARDEALAVLSAEKVNSKTLERRYGVGLPVKPLRAALRGALHCRDGGVQEDVYEPATVELERLSEKHRQTHRTMLDQLLFAEQSNRRTLRDLEDERRKHSDYMDKSDDFTQLLEHERERLKRVVEQERSYQQRRESEHSSTQRRLQTETSQLRALALLLAEERQGLCTQLARQAQTVAEISWQLDQERNQTGEVTRALNEESTKAQRLEADLEEQTTRFYQEHEEMTAKLATEECQSRHLRQKMAGLAHKIEELEESNRRLQRTDEELRRARAEISELQQDRGSRDGLAAELETLRKRLLEMECKDEEIQKTEIHCKELKERLGEEEARGKDLGQEVGRLNERLEEMARMEDGLNKGKMDYESLRVSFDKEQQVCKELGHELEVLRNRVKELEGIERRLGKTEHSLTEDLAKLKSFALMLADERQVTKEHLQKQERKVEEVTGRLKDEQLKLMEVTEKLINESKKSLKLKSDFEEKTTALIHEKEQLVGKLRSEESKVNELISKVGQMKERLSGQDRDQNGAMSHKPFSLSTKVSRTPVQDNKVMELTREVERLQKRLKELEVIEDDLLKTEDEYDDLKRKYRNEQDKAQLLAQQLEEARLQISRVKAFQRVEMANGEEHELRSRLRHEEARADHLSSEVQALKEKLHEMMTTEERLTQFQDNYTSLQQRLLREETRNQDLVVELESLSKELDRIKKYGRALRPALNGRKIIDVPVTTAAVQTDPAFLTNGEEENVSSFIKKTMQEENRIMNNLLHEGQALGERTSMIGRYSSGGMHHEISQRKSYTPWSKRREMLHQNREGRVQVNGHAIPSGDMVLSSRQGQPLHIRVRPDHVHNTAMLEITSPTGDDASYTTTTLIPSSGLQKPRILFQTKSPSPASSDGTARESSPLSITSISHLGSPDSSGSSSPERSASPIQVIDIGHNHGILEETLEIGAGQQAVFHVSSEKAGLGRPRTFGSSHSSITTTDDNKIRIHLGSPRRRLVDGSVQGQGHVGEGGTPAITVFSTEKKEVLSTGTILRRPGTTGAKSTTVSPSISPASAGKMMSSITITPSNGAVQLACENSRATEGCTTSRTSSSTRIPVPRSMKLAKVSPMASSAARLEPGQPVKIEFKKPHVSGGQLLGKN